MPKKTSKPYFEVHITFVNELNMEPIRNIKTARKAFKRVVESFGWTYSCIKGDIVYGPDSKQYATKHFNARAKREAVLEEITMMSSALASAGAKILREKIENVVYDVRF